ncbi:MAG: ABC transporter transmembrane domain-containing protein, partial [Anaerolineae bacterium]|nr:ABC transporter transmembrane domain-containing protein [Anaerolineae bacterium]
MSHHEFEEEEFTTRFNGRTVIRILGLAGAHWPWLVGFLLFIATVSVLGSYFTYLGKSIVDEAILAGDRARLVQLVALYAALLLFQAGCVFGFIYMAGVLGERIRYDLRKKMFDHLQELSFSYFDRTPVGWIMSRVTSDSSRIADLATWGLLDVTWGVMNIGAAVYFMVVINWKLALLVFAIIPILVVIASLFQRKIILEYRRVRKLNSMITGAYN